MQPTGANGERALGQNDQSESFASALPAAASDTGCERALNEDRYTVIEGASGTAWIVCDGMGGEAGGELAAHVAIEAMRRDLEGMPARSPEVALRSAILEGNRVIVLRRQNPVFSTMGTTVVGCLFSGPELVIANVGDSRAYVIEAGTSKQLSVDHTYVQQLVERGELDADDALSHPKAHVLTRALGADPGVKVDSKHFWLHQDLNESVTPRWLLLCSDGLYSLVKDHEMADIVCRGTPQDACVELIELARARGGFDNITIAVIPVPGQLMTEPPPGYEAARRKELTEREKAVTGPQDRVVVFSAAVLLSLMASGIVLLWMLYRLTR